MSATPGVLANMGTPLMWAPYGQLLFGNLLIGVLEGWLIARLFGVRKGVAIPGMIGANYLSLIAGLVFLPALSAAVAVAIAPDIHTAPAYIAAMCVLLFVLTAIVEWPVCLAILRARPRRFRDSWLASFAAQSASYGILVLYYGAASNVSMYREVEITRSLVPSLPSNAVVYFISPEADSLWRVRLDGRELERVADVADDGPSRATGWGPMRGSLQLRAELEPCQKTNRLHVRWYEDRDRERSHAFPEPPIPLDVWCFADADETRWWEAQDLRSPEERSMKVHTGISWGSLDLTGSIQFRLGLETPFLWWWAREATILPGDLVVFEMAQQILVLDVRARKLGLLARGRAPLVAVEREPGAEASSRTPSSPGAATPSTASLPSG